MLLRKTSVRRSPFSAWTAWIAPSARWPCDNLMIYQTNYRFLTERLEVIEEEQVDWGAWAGANDLLPEEPAPSSRNN